MRLLLILLVLGGLAGCQSAPPNARTGAGQQASVPDIKTIQERAQAAYDAGDWVAAEPHYVELARAMPQDAELWFRLGNVYARTDRPELAIAAYRETLVRDPELAKAWFNMGVVQLRQAANSFNQMEVHVKPGDPSRAQAAEAYAAILAILAAGSNASTPDPAPAGAPPPAASEEIADE